MFETLSDRLGGVFDKLRGRGALTEDDVRGAMREVRVALLEADVALPVARDFVETITAPQEDPAAIAALQVPESYRAAVLLAEEQSMFEGLAIADRSPAKSLHIREVPTPEPGPDEVLVRVEAAALNNGDLAPVDDRRVTGFELAGRIVEVG